YGYRTSLEVSKLKVPVTTRNLNQQTRQQQNEQHNAPKTGPQYIIIYVYGTNFLRYSAMGVEMWL
ncbi:Hypothetical predicted protein, partial [Olea europaea subsp. europaea]